MQSRMQSTFVTYTRTTCIEVCSIEKNVLKAQSLKPVQTLLGILNVCDTTNKKKGREVKEKRIK